MYKLILSIIVLFTIKTFTYAGGDISLVTDYEIEDAIVADEEAYPIEEDTYIEEESPYIEPQPIVVTPPVVNPTPSPAPTPIAVNPTPSPVVKKRIYTNGFYAGLGITQGRYRYSCHCGKNNIKVTNRDRTYGVMGRVGYDFNQYVGVEARAMKTTWNSDGSRIEHAGLYLKPMVPVTNSTNIYGLIGVGKTKVKGVCQMLIVML